MSDPETIHASCVLVGEAGLLIRGDSGAGKSTLARDVVRSALRDGRFARLVSDDRTRIRERHGRLVAIPVEPIEGLIEIHGIGIVAQPHESAAVIRLIVDLVEDPPRYPEEHDKSSSLCGVTIPRIRLKSALSSADIVLACLSGVCDTVVTL
ncbi:HPr kinase/phosphorylase [Microvirga roseola]|uniref:HPr kinase/phosphorylase n=1 Tax=Microvirga roseola TaxID=2883126 RepID=UPI001E5A8951|nr:HPr kinase/phosphatase C-terminal domain-containing protein [Microvirga roseola]